MAMLQRLLAVVALVLAVAALAAGDFPRPRQLAQSRAIDALELAADLRDQRPLLLVDLRPAEQREAFALPTAIGLEAARAELAAGNPAPLVLYGHEDSRDWFDLLEDGREVRFLAHGVQAWLDDVIQPTLSPLASPAERLAFEPQAELARYFGGIPRYREPALADGDTDDRIARLERRGCGF